MSNKFDPTIGLEIHAELKTNSKMFCGCPTNHFGKTPNTQTCPVCLGLPGVLPVSNKIAVEWAIIIGLALKCNVSNKSKFDRKHYFYPDLPKGYQISQYDEPLSTQGYLDTSFGKVRIRRVHLEEDTGKLQHVKLNGESVSLVDFNRSGVPLVEIVTEPDIKSGAQAKEFCQELQKILRKLMVSDCDMEKGSMRLEANVSLGLNLGYKVEVKNLNSFRFIERAINYELERQKNLLEMGKKPRQETRGWDENKHMTIIQRYKETEADYRYFPEPDIPPMEFSENYIEGLKRKLPKLPDEISNDLVMKYKIRKDYAQIISINDEMVKYIESIFEKTKNIKVDNNKIVSLIINKKMDISKISSTQFVEKIKKYEEDKITDFSRLNIWVEKALQELPNVVRDYKNGKTVSISVLIGKVMKLSSGSADASSVKVILEKKLKN